MKHFIASICILFCSVTYSFSQTSVITKATKMEDCKPELGYLWSNILVDCIRVFEKGELMIDIQDSTMAAYVIFSADSAIAEVFSAYGCEVLEQILPNTWNSKQNTFTLTTLNGYLQIYQKRILRFEQEAKKRPVIKKYSNKQGFTIYVSFYNSLNKAIVHDGIKSYVLYKYDTYTDFGYKNEEVNIRGTLKNLTILYSNNTIFELQEQ